MLRKEKEKEKLQISMKTRDSKNINAILNKNYNIDEYSGNKKIVNGANFILNEPYNINSKTNFDNYLMYSSGLNTISNMKREYKKINLTNIKNKFSSSNLERNFHKLNVLKNYGSTTNLRNAPIKNHHSIYISGTHNSPIAHHLNKLKKEKKNYIRIDPTSKLSSTSIKSKIEFKKITKPDKKDISYIYASVQNLTQNINNKNIINNFIIDSNPYKNSNLDNNNKIFNAKRNRLDRLDYIIQNRNDNRDLDINKAHKMLTMNNSLLEEKILINPLNKNNFYKEIQETTYNKKNSKDKINKKIYAYKSKNQESKINQNNKENNINNAKDSIIKYNDRREKNININNKHIIKINNDYEKKDNEEKDLKEEIKKEKNEGEYEEEDEDEDEEEDSDDNNIKEKEKQNIKEEEKDKNEKIKQDNDQKINDEKNKDSEINDNEEIKEEKNNDIINLKEEEEKEKNDIESNEKAGIKEEEKNNDMKSEQKEEKEKENEIEIIDNKENENNQKGDNEKQTKENKDLNNNKEEDEIIINENNTEDKKNEQLRNDAEDIEKTEENENEIKPLDNEDLNIKNDIIVDTSENNNLIENIDSNKNINDKLNSEKGESKNDNSQIKDNNNINESNNDENNNDEKIENKNDKNLESNKKEEEKNEINEKKENLNKEENKININKELNENLNKEEKKEINLNNVNMNMKKNQENEISNKSKKLKVKNIKKKKKKLKKIENPENIQNKESHLKEDNKVQINNNKTERNIQNNNKTEKSIQNSKKENENSKKSNIKRKLIIPQKKISTRLTDKSNMIKTDFQELYLTNKKEPKNDTYQNIKTETEIKSIYPRHSKSKYNLISTSTKKEQLKKNINRLNKSPEQINKYKYQISKISKEDNQSISNNTNTTTNLNNYTYLETKNIKNIKKDTFITIHTGGHIKSRFDELDDLSQTFIKKEPKLQEYKPYVSKHKNFKKRGMSLLYNPERKGSRLRIFSDKTSIEYQYDTGNKFKKVKPVKKLSSYFTDSNNNVYLETKQGNKREKKEDLNQNIKKNTIYIRNTNLTNYEMQSEMFYIPKDLI